jgi:signal transduction histidine kinase/ligand-binding sensor domain-containing protein
MLLACVLLLSAPGVYALDPALDVSQFAHKAWNNREGFPGGIIHAIAQTPDGYLWLGTEFGLFRFDGVRAVPWQGSADQHLPTNKIQSLLVTRDGTLWIGTWKGLASWKGGKLTLYPELADEVIFPLIEDQEGAVWAGGFAYNPPGKLCTIQRGVAKCYGEDGSLGNGVLGLYEDRNRNLWAGTRTGLWRWKPSPRKFYPIPGNPAGIQSLVEDDSGTLLIAWRGRVVRFAGGKLQTAYPYPAPAQQSFARTRLLDRDGGLWVGTVDHGLVHVHQGRIDTFAQADGLSGDIVTALFEDREGSVWVATSNGLDRFRDLAVVTYSANQGFPNLEGSVLAARDGSIWVTSSEGLTRWAQGDVTVFHGRGIRAARRPSARDVVVEGLPNSAEISLLQDHGGRIWIAGSGALGYLENDRIVPIRGALGGIVYAMAEDAARNVWIANLDHGLLQLSADHVVRQIPWIGLGHKEAAMALAADPLQGGLWIGFFHGGVSYWKDGQVRASYAAASGLGEGNVSNLRVDTDGTLWAATQGGLSRLRNGRAATLSSKNGLPCDEVHWSIEDDDHSLWLYMTCGLVRIARSDAEAWGNDPSRSVQVTVFDAADGVRNKALVPSMSPKAGKSPNGKIWFMAETVSVVDPHHLPLNTVPPPVYIEQIIADGRQYDRARSLRLPPRVRDLSINYTALSLVVPEKVHFRFKLEGQDQDWREVVNERQVEYSNLGPGKYRFRVTASNNSGVWNETGTFLDFFIAPAYYQTIWFRFCCFAAFMALLLALYQLRVRELAHRFNIRLEERVSERTRIARELHDTLLQSFHGLLLRFQAAVNMLPERPAEARNTLESAIDQAAQAITEGRDAVQGLRASTVDTNGLALAIRMIGEELAAGAANQNSVEFSVQVEGTPRNLRPILRDEVYRIASEALRNAFNHAQARRIEVEIHYDQRQLRLRVRDNGKGIDPKVVSADGRAGHFGLHGMRERANLMGGNLALWSEIDSGTEVELSIPASLAYEKDLGRGSRLSELAGKLSGKGTAPKS